MNAPTSNIETAKLHLLDLLVTPIWIWDFDKSAVWWGNQAALRLWQANDLADLNAKAGTLSESDRATLAACRRFLQNAEPFDGSWPVRADARTVNVACRFTPVTIDGKRLAMMAQVIEGKGEEEEAADERPQYTPSMTRIIGEVGQLLRLLEAQVGILELISGGATLEDSLRSLVQTAERLIGPAAASIMLIQPFGSRLLHVAAPNLPPDYRKAIDGCGIGPQETAMGAAVFRRSRVVSRDIATDPLWARYRDAAAKSGIRACWAQPIVNEDGEILGVFSVHYQQTKTPTNQDCWIIEALSALARFAIDNERRRTDLRSANDRFSSLATTVPGVVYQRVINPQGEIRYTFISDAVKELFGVSPEEVLTNPHVLFDCFDPVYRSDFQKRLANASHELKMWDVEATIISRDGQRKYTHAIARPSRLPDGSVVWDGVILDATRIKQAELAASAAEARTREAIIESIPQGLILFNEHDEAVTCNSRFLELYPFLKDVVKTGLSYSDLMRVKIEAMIKSDGPEEELRQARDEALRQRLEKHAQASYVAEHTLTDGRWILVNEHHNEDGSTVILYTDISELKEREAALERSNRELQDFATVAAHDLQEPLRKIEAFGDRLRERYLEQLSGDGKMYLERMQQAAHRMRQLINDLLTYSRVTSKAQPFVPVDLAKTCEDVLGDLQIAIESSQAKVTSGELPIIDADPLQMRLLLQNLIGNALKFRRKDVPSEITISAVLHDAADAQKKFGIRTGRVCEINVADNGIGFEMKYLDRIFAIFQRLHGRNEYEGTGVGLATCRKLVERHGGVITAQSAPNQGTTFIVALPVKQINPKAA